MLWYVQQIYVTYLNALNCRVRFYGCKSFWTERKTMKVDLIIEMDRRSRDQASPWTLTGMRWCRNIALKPNRVSSKSAIELSLIALTSKKQIRLRASWKHSISLARFTVKSLRLVPWTTRKWRHMIRVWCWVFTKWFTIFMIRNISHRWRHSRNTSVVNLRLKIMLRRIALFGGSLLSF